MWHYFNFALIFSALFNVALFHYFTILLFYHFSILCFAFLILHYCITLKFNYLTILSIVAHFHTIFLLSNYVILK